MKIIELKEKGIGLYKKEPHYNTAEFTAAAQHFKEFNTYTRYPVNTSPNSQWFKFWVEEARRCLYGYNIGRDEIPGYYYWYLNYCPIEKASIIEEEPVSKFTLPDTTLRYNVEDGYKDNDEFNLSIPSEYDYENIRGERITDFPDFWDSDYDCYWYFEEAERAGEHASVLKTRGRGYEQPISELVLTPNGFKPIGEIKVNDFVIGIKGKPVKVLEIIPQGKKDVYEIVFHDNRRVRCGLNHLWGVYNTKGKYVITTTKYLINNRLKQHIDSNKSSYSYKVPSINAVEFDKKELDVDPYLLGVLIGDGNLCGHQVRFSTADTEILFYLNFILGSNYELKKDKSTPFKFTIKSLIKGYNSLIRDIKKLNLNVKSHNKFIPNEYKYSSIEQRFELIKGLMDTDGTVSEKGNCRFTSSSEKLIDDIAWVFRSLGIRCRKAKTNLGGKLTDFGNGNKSIVRDSWILSITTDKQIFKLKRKAEKLNAGIKNRKLDNYDRIGIKEIKKLNYTEESTCIYIDCDDHLYLTTDFIPTHNSFKGASMLDRNFYLIPRAKSYAFASEKEYLISDGILTKAWDMMGHIEVNTPWGKRKAKIDTMMHKRASYMKIHKGIQSELGFGSEIIGVTFKNNIDKGRGKRGKLILWEEAGIFPNLLPAWNISLKSMSQGRITFGLMIAFGCVCKGTKVWNNKGDLINIEDLKIEEGILGFDGKQLTKENITYYQEPIKKLCYRIVTNTGRFIECSNDHPILWSNQHFGSQPRTIIKGKRPFIKKTIFKKTEDIKIGDQIAIIDEVPIWGKKKMWEPRLIGWLIGDGSYGFDKTPVLSNCEDEINRYIINNFDTKIEKSYFTKQLKIYQETRIKNICYRLRELGIYGQTKLKKTLPINIHSYRKSDIVELIGGLFDTDGYVYNHRISITSMSFNLLYEILLLLQKLGIHGNITMIKKSEKNIKDKNDYFRLEIADKDSVISFANQIKFKVKVKDERLKSVYYYYSNKESQNSKNIVGLRFERVIKVENIGVKEVYNLTANNSHTYIANGIVTHNTGGTDVNDLMGLEQLWTRGDGYKVYLIPNTFEPEMGYEKTGYFIGEQRSHEVAMDKDGNSNEVVALKYIAEDRKKHLDKTKNREMHLRYCAEAPIKPSEALMQLGNNIFPIDLLKQHKAFLLSHKESILDAAWIGSLSPDPETGKIKWSIDKDAIPIDHYPHNDLININGAVVIYEPPITNREGIIPPGLYISGNDNYDHDQSTTDSLGSTFIMSRMTERIVAEFTGRPPVASMFYMQNMYLLMYYNAVQNFENNLQGLRNHMRKHHMEYRLCDTPTIIIDKIDDKRVLNRGKGTPGTTPIIKYGLELILEWLMREAEPGTGILNLHKIKSIALLDELIYFNNKGNFDRVLALIYLLILHEDLWKHKPDIDHKPKAKVDPFFANNPLFKYNKADNKTNIIFNERINNPFNKYFDKS